MDKISWGILYHVVYFNGKEKEKQLFILLLSLVEVFVIVDTIGDSERENILKEKVLVE
ncbi:MAG: hypothetical protein ACJ719_11425 [Nitrososphaeraceae archaeon]